MTRDLGDPLLSVDWSSHKDDGEGWAHNTTATCDGGQNAAVEEDLLMLGVGGDQGRTESSEPHAAGGGSGSDPLLNEDELLGTGNPPTAPTSVRGNEPTHVPSVSSAAVVPPISLVSTPTTQPASGSPVLPTACIHCGQVIGNLLSTTCDAGILHNECVAAYRLKTTERCAHCQNILRISRSLVGALKVHPECVSDFKSGRPYVQPRIAGMLKKFSVGRSFIGRKNWQDRFVVVSKALDGIAYFQTEADALAYEQGSREKPPKGVAPLAAATSRLITMPTHKQHPKATSASKELIVIFHEGEKRQERKLLLQFTSWDQRCAWLAVLETYVHIVDDLHDYEDK